MIEFAEQQILHLTRLNLRRDIAEVADDPEPSVRQLDTIDPPLVIFFCPAIPTLLRTFRPDVRVAGYQRVAKDAHHLVGVLLVPEDMHDLVEVPPDDPARNVSKRGKCDGVDDANFEIRIDEIDTDRRLVDQCLELHRAVPQRDFGPLALKQIRRLPYQGELRVAIGEPKL